MQELLVDFITSLDGYGAAEGWPGWWGLEGPEYLVSRRGSQRSRGYRSRSPGSTAQARSPRTRPSRSRCLATHR